MKFIKILRFGFLFLLVVSFLLQPSIVLSLSDIPNDNLSYPVLIKTKEGKTGSGFFYKREGMLYLITARHVLFDDMLVIRLKEKFDIPTDLKYKFYMQESESKDEKGKFIRTDFIFTFSGVISESEKDKLINAAPDSDKEGIKKLYDRSQELQPISSEITLLSYGDKVTGVTELNINLKELFKNGHVKYHPSQDVAFLRIGSINKVNNEDRVKILDGIIKERKNLITGLDQKNIKFLKDVIIGNQVFVFGYPTSITQINPSLDINMPLLRKGVVAGKNEVLKAIILDCPAFYGNSGGLVIEVEQDLCCSFQYKAIGLISQFAPYDNQWFQNSGYSIVVPMDFVEELIINETK